jgi:hypothetical protein
MDLNPAACGTHSLRGTTESMVADRPQPAVRMFPPALLLRADEVIK